MTAYTEAQQTMKAPEKAKRAALKTLKAWMRRKGDAKATIAGRTVSLVQSRRYAVNYTRLNSLLDPGGQGRDSHGAGVGVRQGQLDASTHRKRTTFFFPFTGRWPRFHLGAGGSRHINDRGEML